MAIKHRYGVDTSKINVLSDQDSTQICDMNRRFIMQEVLLRAQRHIK